MPSSLPRSVCLALIFALACASNRTDPPASPRAPGRPQPDLVRFAFERPAMGTVFRVVLYAPSEAVATAASEAAYARLDAVEEVATDYDQASEARRLPRAASSSAVLVSPDLANVLRAADRVVRASGGAFDPTIGGLSQHWRRALRQRKWPQQSRWDDAVRRVGWQRLVRIQDTERGLTVRTLSPGVRLDFGGVAKGVAVDEMLAELSAHGIERALVDGGGDLASLGPPPGEEGWRVTVRPFGDDPASELSLILTRGAVATSGGAFQSARLAGPPLKGITDPSRRFGHLLDPRTGLPLAVPRAAVMTAATATEADALATALLVLGKQPNGTDPAFEQGMFFEAPGTPPCVGASFPQDGVRFIQRRPIPETPNDDA